MKVVKKIKLLIRMFCVFSLLNWNQIESDHLSQQTETFISNSSKISRKNMDKCEPLFRRIHHQSNIFRGLFKRSLIIRFLSLNSPITLNFPGRKKTSFVHLLVNIIHNPNFFKLNSVDKWRKAENTINPQISRLGKWPSECESMSGYLSRFIIFFHRR